MFAHLRGYIEQQLGRPAWEATLTAAGLGPRIYLPIKSYPDQELVAMVTAAAQTTGQEVPALLEDFGRYIAPHLVSMYRHLLSPAWRTIDVLEHVESTAHRAVRLEQPEATPPYLQARRISERQIAIDYTSARRLCHVAKGIIRGLGQHFGETLSIAETSCMHHGADRCALVVTAGA